jgi:hypothetical protein
MLPTVKTRWSSPSICIECSFAASSAIVVVSPFIRVIRAGAIYGSYAALHAIHSSSPERVEGKFSETEELLFALPSPLIYYPLNEQPMRFRIRYLRKD